MSSHKPFLEFNIKSSLFVLALHYSSCYGELEFKIEETPTEVSLALIEREEGGSLGVFALNINYVQHCHFLFI
jgi:hypothetical protein